MKMTKSYMSLISLIIILVIGTPFQMMAQPTGNASAVRLSKGELSQLLAPIALYPDELVAQILMASTYPLEIVQADRWVQQNKNLKGDALAKALEQQPWDPSVKSLVNFPSILSMMSQKLDITTKLGDAFLSQQKDVMDTIQDLRKKAYSEGNLKSTDEQKVVVEKETIVIQPSNPQVVYVPSYNPTVVYGAWTYPAYPPYPYFPPGYVAGAAFTFAAGVALGAAWGYAWGGCNWNRGDVNVNVNRNANLNRNINYSKYQQQLQARGQVNRSGQGTWRHDPSHRKNVAYTDRTTAQKFGQSPARSTEARRDARGYGDGRTAAGTGRTEPRATDRGRAPGAERGTPSREGRIEPARSDRGQPPRAGRDSAFSGVGNGRQERMASERGASSRASSSQRGAAPSRGGGGGFSRGGGGRGGRGGRR
jgi:uncharacterized membrane protein YgcG